MADGTPGIHTISGTGKALWGPGDMYTFLVTGEQTGGSHFAMEGLVPPGGGPPPHTHDNEDEMFLVVDGILEVQEKSENRTLGAGEFYIVKRGVEHRVVPHGHVKLILFEPAEIKHTGDAKSEITRKQFDYLEL